MSIYKLVNKKADSLCLNFNLKTDDPTLNKNREKALLNTYYVDKKMMNKLFLDEPSLEYISEHYATEMKLLRIVTSPDVTNTCYEKSYVLNNWNPINIIKSFYLESTEDGYLYALIVPETGCFIDKNNVREELGINDNVKFIKATYLPQNMEFGTCSPFIQNEDLVQNGGSVKYVIFDSESLIETKSNNTIDDFSFHKDHRFSIQMNYYQCYQMLKRRFPGSIIEREVLPLSFKEHLIRKKGNIKVNYEFKSLNYRTAQFINKNHGFGDVSITNDHVDELFIPDFFSIKQSVK